MTCHIRMHGVAMLMTRDAARALLSWERVSPRTVIAGFSSKGRKVTILRATLPHMQRTWKVNEQFTIKCKQHSTKRQRDSKILMEEWDPTTHPWAEQCENGELFIEFCTFN
jgi:hypothetical protein